MRNGTLLLDRPDGTASQSHGKQGHGKDHDHDDGQGSSSERNSGSGTGTGNHGHHHGNDGRDDVQGCSTGELDRVAFDDTAAPTRTPGGSAHCGRPARRCNTPGQEAMASKTAMHVSLAAVSCSVKINGANMILFAWLII